MDLEQRLYAKEEMQGVDPKRYNHSMGNHRKSSYSPGRRGGKNIIPWSQIPQLINFMRFQRMQELPLNEKLDYEPVHLNIFTTTSCLLSCRMCYGHSTEIKQNFRLQNAAKDMDFETFQFALEQVPTVKTLTFSGWGEPLLNGEIFEMVNYAHSFNRASSTIITNGLLIENRLDALLASRLKKLVVSINGYTPEGYTALTGMPADHFYTAVKNVKLLVREKIRRNLKLQIALSIVVDSETYKEIPQMIRFAAAFPVEELILENYISPDTTQPSARSLYRDNVEAMVFLHNMQTSRRYIDPVVVWPKVLDREMENHRNCRDAFTSVGVDGDLNISACSRQLLYQGKMGKIWDAEFWNNEMYQWLRGVYGTQQHEVPRPCQGCPNNCADAPLI